MEALLFGVFLMAGLVAVWLWISGDCLRIWFGLGVVDFCVCVLRCGVVFGLVELGYLL